MHVFFFAFSSSKYFFGFHEIAFHRIKESGMGFCKCLTLAWCRRCFSWFRARIPKVHTCAEVVDFENLMVPNECMVAESGLDATEDGSRQKLLYDQLD